MPIAIPSPIHLGVRGINYVKISRYDVDGTDNTLSLYALEKLIIGFDDLGVIEFPVLEITEFPTYYLYKISTVNLGYVTSKFKSPILPSSSAASFVMTASSNSSIFNGYTNVTGSIGSNGLVTLGQGGLPITISCSFSASATVVTNLDNFYIIFTGSNGVINKQLIQPTVPSSTGVYTASFSYTPTSSNVSFGVMFASSSLTVNYNLPSIDLRVIQDITSSIDNNILNHNFSASSYTGSNLYVVFGQSNFISGSDTVVDILNYYNTSSGIYTYGDTPNTKINFSASIDISSSFNGSFELRENTTNPIFLKAASFTPGRHTISGSFTPLENSIYQLFLSNEDPSGVLTASNIQWSFTQSEIPHSESKITYLDPYLSMKFVNSDYDALLNNASEIFPNPNFMNVDYNYGSIIAENFTNIINGTATPSTVKDYYYNLERHTKPRYLGSKNTTDGINTASLSNVSLAEVDANNDLGASKTGKPSVESLGTYFAYFDFASSTNYELINKKAFHILYLIDSSGSVLTPNLDSPYYYNLVQNFERGKKINISYSTTSGNVSNTQGLQPILRSGFVPKPIIWSQSGSVPNTSDSIEFSNLITGISNYATSLNLSTRSYTNYTYQNILDAPGSPTVNFTSSVTTASLAGSDRNIKVTTSTDKTQIIPSLTITLRNNPGSSGAGTFPSFVNFGVKIIKSEDDGSTWSTIASFVDQVSNIDTTFTFTGPAQIAQSGSNYRTSIEFTGPFGGTGHTISQLGGTFNLSQTTPPTQANINKTLKYWTTGSISKNVLTGSQFTNAVYGNIQSFPSSSMYSPNVPFTVKRGDEIRFGGDENQTYLILEVSDPNKSSDGKLYLTLDRNIVDGTDMDCFFLRRYKEDANFIVVDVPSEGGGTGFLFPEYTSLEIQQNFNKIVQDLKGKGTIPQ